MSHSLIIRSRVGTTWVGATLAALLPTTSALAQEGSGSSFRQGVAAGAGVMQINGVGPWIDLRYLLEWVCPSPFFVRIEPGIAYAWNSENSTIYLTGPAGSADFANHNKQRLFAIPINLLFGLRIGSLGLEAGGIVGVALNAASTSICGSENYLAPYWGLMAGLSVRFGSRDQFHVAGHGATHTVPALRCTNEYVGKEPNTHLVPVMYHERDFESVGGYGAFGYYFE